MTAPASSSRSVVQRFVSSAAAYPDRPALWTREQAWTYTELSRAAARVLRQIRGAGLEHAERIGILTGDDPQTYAAILAILANGSAYVPLNSKSPVARNLAVIAQARPEAVLHVASDPLTDTLEDDAKLDVVTLAIDSADDGSGALLTAPAVSGDALAYLFFTSGSTGTPKGVPISHGNLNRFMAAMLEAGIYDFGPTDRFLQMFELTFDLSVMSLFVPLCVGACCHVVPDSRIGYVATLKVLRDQRITVALMVPSLLVYLEPYLRGLRLPDLRISMFCGEALPESVTEKWHTAAPDSIIENVYGPTEATIFCLRHRWSATTSPEAAMDGLVPIGQPLPGMQVALLDPAGDEITTAGQKGELVLVGDQLTAGYWRDPARTKAAFLAPERSPRRRPGYRTGDLCCVDQRGDFVYCGRLDAQVKIDGHRVELGEIEHHLRALLDRAGVAVVDVADGLRRELAVFIEAATVDWPDLCERLRERVPLYMIPKHVRLMERLPLNLNGKVDRPRLRRMLQDECDREL